MLSTVNISTFKKYESVHSKILTNINKQVEERAESKYPGAFHDMNVLQLKTRRGIPIKVVATKNSKQ